MVSNREERPAPIDDPEPTPDQIPPAPVDQRDRIRSLDVLRGVAVLGILLVNVWAYGLVFPASTSPRYVGANTPLDQAVVFFVWMVAYTKFLPVFSMLFGAGVVLFSERVEARGLKARGLFFSRQLWLLVLGLVHAYLLWNGDILVPYAICGMIVFVLRRKKPRTLVIVGVALILVPLALGQVGGFFVEMAQRDGEAAEAVLASGGELTAGQQQALDAWREQRKTWSPTSGDTQEVIDAMRSSYGVMLEHTVPETLMLHAVLYPLLYNWIIAGLMLIGMALYTTGILSGDRADSFYARAAAVCYAVGLPVVAAAFFIDIAVGDRAAMQVRLVFPMQQLSGSTVALGHVALIVLAARRGWLGFLEPRFAAAGRMAFSNYIAQTLICITIFYGFGFGLFHAMNRLELLGVAVAISALELWWSPWWLARFRFGPLEWLWRSLTYRRLQPLRRGRVADAVA